MTDSCTQVWTGLNDIVKSLSICLMLTATQSNNNYWYFHPLHGSRKFFISIYRFFLSFLKILMFLLQSKDPYVVKKKLGRIQWLSLLYDKESPDRLLNPAYL